TSHAASSPSATTARSRSIRGPARPSSASSSRTAATTVSDGDQPAAAAYDTVAPLPSEMHRLITCICQDSCPGQKGDCGIYAHVHDSYPARGCRSHSATPTTTQNWPIWANSSISQRIIHLGTYSAIRSPSQRSALLGPSPTVT